MEPLNPAGLLPMTIKIKNCSHDSDESVEWSVGDNRSAWAICGKTRGLLSIESEKIKEVKVDLMPLFQGSLRLPQEKFVFMFYLDISFTIRIPTEKLKIPGKAFLKSESRTFVTFKL